MTSLAFNDIDSVNHTGLAVHDLDAAALLYERMGFVLSPLSVHSGSLKPGEPVQTLASANRCAIFPSNYVELLGIVNPGAPDWGCGKFLDKFQGAHILCFGCGDAASVDARVKEAGVDTSGVVKLSRDVGTVDGTRTASFDCVHFSNMPEGLIQAAHHRTPEFIHQPRYLTHPNGVTALTEVVFLSERPDEAAASYAVLAGQPVSAESGSSVITLPNGNRLRFLGGSAIAKEFPGTLFSPAPSIVAQGFVVADLNAVDKLLKAGGFRTRRSEGRIVVPAEQALGVVHYFTAS